MSIDWCQLVDEMSGNEKECADDITIGYNGGRVSALDALTALRGELGELGERLDQMRSVNDTMIQENAELSLRRGAREAGLERTIASLRGEMAKLARKLADAGESDHKRKNEVILWVIARLLYIGETPPVLPDIEDIPF